MSRWVSYSTGGNFSISNSYLRMPTITNICSYTNNSNLVITKNTNVISVLVSNINSSFDTFINNKLNDQINFSLKIYIQSNSSLSSNPSNTSLPSITIPIVINVPNLTFQIITSSPSPAFTKAYGLTTDETNVYIADTYNHIIRKIDSNGNVSIIAGTGIAGYSDGSGTSAQFNYPCGICIDSKNNLLYIADSQNHCIRLIYLSTNIVSTIAGLGGTSGLSDGSGTTSRFNGPCGISIDSARNLYVADTWNNSIRYITYNDWIVSTIIGSPTLKYPRSVCVTPSNDIYIADTGNHCIRLISNSQLSTIGIAGSYGTDNSKFFCPYSLSFDTNTNTLYIADLGSKTIKTIINKTTISSLQLGFSLKNPISTCFLPGKLYISDPPYLYSSNLNSIITTFGKNPNTILKNPYGLLPGTYLKIIDNSIIKSKDNSIISQFSGLSVGNPYNYPNSMVNDSLGNIYIADTCNNVIKKKDSRGVSTIAGSSIPGYIDGVGISAQFYNPCGICIDSNNNLYIADTVNNCIRKINNTNTVSTISTGFNGPCGICIDSNRNLYIADTYNHCIKKIDINLNVSIIAGISGNPGNTNGNKSIAQFYIPNGIACDNFGYLYITDYGNKLIRQIDPNGNVSTLTINDVSTFSSLHNICIDSNRVLYISHGQSPDIPTIKPPIST